MCQQTESFQFHCLFCDIELRPILGKAFKITIQNPFIIDLFAADQHLEISCFLIKLFIVQCFCSEMRSILISLF